MHSKQGMNSFGVWLKCSLIEADMKQRDLAKLMIVSEVSVSRWVRGDRYPTRSEFEKIMEFFNCHIEIVPNELPRDWR